MKGMLEKAWGWRLTQDVEREALKSYLGATHALYQGIAHSGLVETLPSVEPLGQQPDLADRPSGGGTPRESPVSFYGPDRALTGNCSRRAAPMLCQDSTRSGPSC